MNKSMTVAEAPKAGALPYRITIGQREVAYASFGPGSSTIVLETGLGAESAEWSIVAREVANFARVFHYDRAGRGTSTAAAKPRDALMMVDDLHELLHKADIPGPYLLVGHSFGGLLMRLFARKYRPEVAGLVLVDSMHEDQFDVMGAAFPPPEASDPPALAGIRQFWTGGWKRPDSTTERIDLVESIRQGREITSLDNLPLHVLTAGTFRTMPLVPDAHRDTLQGLWEGLQARFAPLSSRSKQTFVPASGHFIQRDDPHAIVEAIRDVRRRGV
jgi:pimeloyl-ACP methyl ester carboxylesterase